MSFSPAPNSSSKANIPVGASLLLSLTAPGEKEAGAGHPFGLTQLRTTDEGTQGPLLSPSPGRLKEVGSYWFSWCWENVSGLSYLYF